MAGAPSFSSSKAANSQNVACLLEEISTQDLLGIGPPPPPPNLFNSALWILLIAHKLGSLEIQDSSASNWLVCPGAADPGKFFQHFQASSVRSVQGNSEAESQCTQFVYNRISAARQESRSVSMLETLVKMFYLKHFISNKDFNKMLLKICRSIVFRNSPVRLLK